MKYTGVVQHVCRSVPTAERVYYQVPHIHIVLFFNYAWLYGRPTGNNDVELYEKHCLKISNINTPLYKRQCNAAEQP